MIDSPFNMRVWSSGKMVDSKSADEGSIPFTLVEIKNRGGNMVKNLIGSQVLEVGGDFIKVKKYGKVHILEILSSNGDCCGYSEFGTYLLYSPSDERNPIITDVKVSDEYPSGGGNVSSVTFFGEYKPLITIESESGSSSGHDYGAHVTLQCKDLGLDESLSSW